ncbi:MAG: Nif3-like dinuclear metal center hexameric protein [Candidatus Bipolaricaulota bacterium]
MNTDRLMSIALEMAGMLEIPGDSAVHHAGDRIRRVLVGIDLRAPELLAARELGFDAVIAHHPVGLATLGFHRVLERHIGQMIEAGVPEAVAREVMAETIEARRRADASANFDHDPSIARLLDMPYLNIHTPLDELGRRRLAAVAATVSPEARVGQLIDALCAAFGELRNAPTPIEPVVGTRSDRVGRVVVSHGAGTNGGAAVARAYFQHGVDTVIYIHCRPEEARRLEQDAAPGKTLLVTGHMASDSIGINPYVARLREEGLEVTTASGVIAP